MKLYVARHGTTAWNELNKMQGWHNENISNELNSSGILQTEELKKTLDSVQIDLIISSPLKRAVQSSKIIAHGRNIEIIYDNRLKDRRYGIFEGKSPREFDYKRFWNYDENNRYENDSAENIVDFFNRVYNLIDELKKADSNKHILILTHNSVTKAIYCYFNGIPNDKHISGIGLKHSKYTEYII